MDDDEASDALAALQDMGFNQGLCVDALMRSNGDVLSAANLLAADQDADDGERPKKGKGRKPGGAKGKGKSKGNGKNVPQAPSPKQVRKLARASSPDRFSLASGNDSDNGGTSSDDGGRGKGKKAAGRRKGGKSASQMRAARSAGEVHASPPMGSANKNMSFKEKREAAVAARKLARDSKQTCKVCGGPHPRRECPGIIDGGKGQSRHRGATKQFNKVRREYHRKERPGDSALGEWTDQTPYLDGLSDLTGLHQALATEASDLGEFIADFCSASSFEPICLQGWHGYCGGVTMLPLLNIDGSCFDFSPLLSLLRLQQQAPNKPAAQVAAAEPTSTTADDEAEGAAAVPPPRSNNGCSKLWAVLNVAPVSVVEVTAAAVAAASAAGFNIRAGKTQARILRISHPNTAQKDEVDINPS